MRKRLRMWIVGVTTCLVWGAGNGPVAGAAPATVATQAQGPASGEAGRDAWQRVPDIFAAMGVAEGSVVADIGAGGGYFTARLSKAVGATGRVYAVDVSSSALTGLRQRVGREGLTNVEVVQGTA